MVVYVNSLSSAWPDLTMAETEVKPECHKLVDSLPDAKIE